MEKIIFLYLFSVICEGMSGPIIPWLQNEKLQEQSCDNTLVENTSDLSPHSLYYMRPYHCENYKEHERSKLLPLFEAQSASSEQKLCPFKWIENVQENRIPRIIMTAECGNTCESVTYTLPVLRMDSCNLGYSVFRQELETITVACIPKTLQTESPGMSNSDVPPYHVVTSKIKDLPKSPKLVERQAATSDFQQLAQNKLAENYEKENFASVPPYHVVGSKIRSPLGQMLVERIADKSKQSNPENEPERSLMKSSALIPPYHVVRSRITGSTMNQNLHERKAVTSKYKLEDPE